MRKYRITPVDLSKEVPYIVSAIRTRLYGAKGIGMCKINAARVDLVKLNGLIISQGFGRIETRNQRISTERVDVNIKRDFNEIRIKDGLIKEIGDYEVVQNSHLVKKNSLKVLMLFADREGIHERESIDKLGWKDLTRAQIRLQSFLNKETKWGIENNQNAISRFVEKTTKHAKASLLLGACAKRMESLIREKEKRKNKYYTPQEVDVLSADGLEELLREYRHLNDPVGQERRTIPLFRRRLVADGSPNIPVFGQYINGEYGFKDS